MRLKELQESFTLNGSLLRLIQEKYVQPNTYLLAFNFSFDRRSNATSVLNKFFTYAFNGSNYFYICFLLNTEGKLHFHTLKD